MKEFRYGANGPWCSKIVNFCRTEAGLTSKWGRISPAVYWWHQKQCSYIVQCRRATSRNGIKVFSLHTHSRTKSCMEAGTLPKNHPPMTANNPYFAFVFYYQNEDVNKKLTYFEIYQAIAIFRSKFHFSNFFEIFLSPNKICVNAVNF